MIEGRGIIWCVAMGPGTEEYVTPLARKVLKELDLFIGDGRFAPLLPPGAALEPLPSQADLYRRVEALAERGDVAVLVSGDAGFFSLASSLARHFGERVRWIPGISSLQILASRLRRSWASVPTVSIHGRPLGKELPEGEVVFLLGEAPSVPAQIAEIAGRLGRHCHAVLGWDLGLPSERLLEGTLDHLASLEPTGRLALLWVTQR